MKIKWLGHSCFEMTSHKGIVIVTDPFDNTVGYKTPNVRADVVSVSHDHYDHNFTDAIEGGFELINKVGVFYTRDINITGIPSYHDNHEGKKRGDNIIFTYNIDDIKVCHLGDLGHTLDEKQISEIGIVDVLLIPVGGNFTIDAKETFKVVEQIKPQLVIPMHFKTPVMNFPIDSEEPFLKEIGGGERIESNVLEVVKENLDGERKVYVFKYVD